MSGRIWAPWHTPRPTLAVRPEPLEPNPLWVSHIRRTSIIHSFLGGVENSPTLVLMDLGSKSWAQIEAQSWVGFLCLSAYTHTALCVFFFYRLLGTKKNNNKIY
ncbi:hypothetical protein HanXRQr2_Chr10g0464541 [Helianthus annuus]|uniref:Uncharacterized protein n=1 Tax=Helianthus annuus TaxID=4232 RepID=A0A9K3I1D6_HELAN|nr:hypothetical protein HanXRQr2_Chr10g0464541 [Helianthus annuus]